MRFSRTKSSGAGTSYRERKRPRNNPYFLLVAQNAGNLGMREVFRSASNDSSLGRRHRRHHAMFEGMAIYRVTAGIFFGTGFAAEATYVETQHGFLTQAGALDWVGARLVEDQDPAREA
jgi:hypothetical protein